MYDIPRADGGVTTVTHNWSSPNHVAGSYSGANYAPLSSEAAFTRKFVGGNSNVEVWSNFGVLVAGITVEAYKQNEPAIKTGIADLEKKVDAATGVVKQKYNDTAAAAGRATTTIKENWQAVSNSQAVKTTADLAKSVADEIRKASAEVSKTLTQDSIVKKKAYEYWESFFGK